jgi:hypothetical protein
MLVKKAKKVIYLIPIIYIIFFPWQKTFAFEVAYRDVKFYSLGSNVKMPIQSDPQIQKLSDSDNESIKSKFNHITRLSKRSISMNNRQNNTYTGTIFKKNILLTLARMSNSKMEKSGINWTDIEKPFEYELILNPGETFAFHDNLLPEYKNKLIKTTNSHFSANEGFLNDGYLYGNGVCHLASLINWAASGTGLHILAPVSHDFAVIPEISREFGVSIYSSTNPAESNGRQNLYITNTFEKPVIFTFDYKNDSLSLEISLAEYTSL